MKANVYGTPTPSLDKMLRRHEGIRDVVLVFKLFSLFGEGKNTQGSLPKNIGSLQLACHFSIEIKSFEAKEVLNHI